jgi:hypothetical protein
VFRVATFHHTHRTDKHRKLQIPYGSVFSVQYSLVGTYSDGRHKDLVNKDSLEECSKASCAISASAKRELDFEILVPAPNEGT